MHFLKRFLKAVLHTSLALLLIFEEWGWEPLARTMDRLARLPVWSQLEKWVRQLPPYAALFAFFVPMLSLLPVKLLAFYWISKGDTVLGLLLVLATKVLGTAIVARLFQLTQPALMQLPWFARYYSRWKVWKDGIIAQVKCSRPWRLAHAGARQARRAVQKLARSLRQLFR
ncbi:hypothetical protein [Rhodoferax sp.]|uniref:hypothetical protein n=1 Tax=Rhodoferax sp. TaxID=50421 RepID=UPI00374D3888